MSGLGMFSLRMFSLRMFSLSMFSLSMFSLSMFSPSMFSLSMLLLNAGPAQARTSVSLPPLPPFSTLPPENQQLLNSPDDLARFHHDAVVVDLHVDPLLWNEDLSRERRVRRRSGMVDWPKMKRGGLDVAVMGIVTHGLPVINGWRLFTWFKGWPKAARRSPWQSTQFQLACLERWIGASNGSVVRLAAADALDAVIGSGKRGVMLGVEGAQALEGAVSRVETLAAQGVLYMGRVHLTGNALAGSSYPHAGTGGVTQYGWQVIRAMEKAGIWIDLAHLSPRAFWEVMNGTTGPVLSSHTGISAVFPHWRNLDDEQLRAIAARDGMVGIMAAPDFLGGRSLEHFLAHLHHAVKIMGINRVGIGSDLDGFIVSSDQLKDVSAVPNLTRLLLLAGYRPEEVQGLLGGNFVRMLRRFRPSNLPTGSG